MALLVLRVLLTMPQRSAAKKRRKAMHVSCLSLKYIKLLCSYVSSMNILYDYAHTYHDRVHIFKYILRFICDIIYFLFSFLINPTESLIYL